jgi:hypothetical protein
MQNSYLVVFEGLRFFASLARQQKLQNLVGFRSPIDPTRKSNAQMRGHPCAISGVITGKHLRKRPTGVLQIAAGFAVECFEIVELEYGLRREKQRFAGHPFREENAVRPLREEVKIIDLAWTVSAIEGDPAAIDELGRPYQHAVPIEPVVAGYVELFDWEVSIQRTLRKANRKVAFRTRLIRRYQSIACPDPEDFPAFPSQQDDLVVDTNVFDRRVARGRQNPRAFCEAIWLICCGTIDTGKIVAMVVMAMMVMIVIPTSYQSRCNHEL